MTAGMEITGIHQMSRKPLVSSCVSPSAGLPSYCGAWSLERGKFQIKGTQKITSENSFSLPS